MGRVSRPREASVSGGNVYIGTLRGRAPIPPLLRDDGSYCNTRNCVEQQQLLSAVFAAFAPPGDDPHYDRRQYRRVKRSHKLRRLPRSKSRGGLDKAITASELVQGAG